MGMTGERGSTAAERQAGLTMGALGVHRYHTRRDGPGRRRTQHSYFARANTPYLTDWALVPERLATHPDPGTRTFFTSIANPGRRPPDLQSTRKNTQSPEPSSATQLWLVISDRCAAGFQQWSDIPPLTTTWVSIIEISARL